MLLPLLCFVCVPGSTISVRTIEAVYVCGWKMITNELHQEKWVLTAYADKEGPDQPTHTVNSHLEAQETLWNTLRYLYIDISDLQKWGKKIIQTTTFHKWICNLTPENRDILKILWKRGEIAP